MEKKIEKTKIKMHERIEHLNLQLQKIRTGRANPNILDGITVESYGVETPINQVAIITVSEARQLRITPFDKSNIENLDHAINKANIGISPINDGENIRLNIPPLTEELRKSYTKNIKKYGEDEKIIIRNIRRDINDIIKKSDLTDTLKSMAEDDVQKITNTYIKKVDEIVQNKEKETMKI